MGLVEVSEKMTTSVTIPTKGSRNAPSSTLTNSSTPANISSDQVVRKKRTFDIAFLTGQTEKETSFGGSSPRRGSSNNNQSPDGTNSDSSIDVESDSQSYSPSSSISEQHSSPLVVIHHQHHHRHHGGTLAGSGSRKLAPLTIESRRTIDINQTVDSLKIKENLHFGLNLGNGSLPHLASTIALLPHVARFPLGISSLASVGGGISSNHHMAGESIPFHAKMEKSESINISYPKVRGAFPDPYAALAASAVSGYPYPNLLLPQEMRHPSFPSPLGSPGSSSCGGRSTGSGGIGQQVNQISPSGPQCGTPTLLPPSLTSLSLPAQNVCAKCNIGFRMTSDLVYHMRSHHRRDIDPMKKVRESNRGLTCTVCGENFRERHHLTRHLTAHKDRAEETN